MFERLKGMFRQREIEDGNIGKVPESVRKVSESEKISGYMVGNIFVPDNPESFPGKRQRVPQNAESFHKNPNSGQGKYLLVPGQYGVRVKKNAVRQPYLGFISWKRLQAFADDPSSPTDGEIEQLLHIN